MMLTRRVAYLSILFSLKFAADIICSEGSNQMSTGIEIFQSASPGRMVAFNEPKPPNVLHVTLHQSVSIVCEAASINGPAPQVFWVRKGKTISGALANSQSTVTENVVASTTSSLLYLDCLSANALGTYTCVAENKFGKVTTNTELVLCAGRPAHNAKTRARRNHCRNRLMAKEAPRIIMWSKNVLQTQGLNAKLFCRAIGNPKPNITWQLQQDRHQTELGGLELSPVLIDNEKHKLLRNGDLVVENLEFPKDMGNYVCRAHNSMGVALAEAFVYPVGESL